MTDDSSYDYVENAEGKRLRLPDDPEARQMVMDALYPQLQKKPEPQSLPLGHRVWNWIGGFFNFYVTLTVAYLIVTASKFGWAALIVVGYVIVHRVMRWKTFHSHDAWIGSFIGFGLLIVVSMFLSITSSFCC